MRHSRATLQPLNVPQQGCAAPLGNTLPLFRRRNIRIDPVMNKPGDTFGTAYTLGRHYKPISSHNRAARHSRATYSPKVFPNSAMRHSRATLLPLKRSPTVLRGTLGQHYKPISFPNSSARHPWATLQPLNVPQQFCAAPSGNALPLFRRWRVRIDPASNKLGDTFSALGRRYKPISSHNRAALHSRATLQPQNVPQQFCAAPLGDVTSPHRSPTEPRDTLGQRFATFSSPKRTH